MMKYARQRMKTQETTMKAIAEFSGTNRRIEFRFNRSDSDADDRLASTCPLCLPHNDATHT